MARTVIALYDDRAEAQAAVQDLVNNGFSRDVISLLAHDTHGESYISHEGHERAASPVASGASIGAASGAAIGGLGGLLLGLGVFAIPGLGPLVAAGPVVAALTGAGVGAVAGGLIGALTGLGVPKEEAEVYAEGVRRGGMVVTLQAADDQADLAAAILRRHNAVDVHLRGEEWRKAGWTGYDPNAPAYTADQIRREREARIAADGQPGFAMREARAAQTGVVDREAGVSSRAEASSTCTFEDYEDAFRRDFEATLSNRDYTYEHHLPAYRYGYSLATDEKYCDRSWDQIEGEARSFWEERNPGTWAQFRNPIHHAWETVRGKR